MNKSLFSKLIIKNDTTQTPFFLLSHETLSHNYNQHKELFPDNTEICYAMKANSEQEVLKTLMNLGSSFEAASLGELSLLKEIGVSAEKIIFGSSVKSAEAIKQFYEFGVRRFAYDNKEELIKIAQNAPHSKVFLRVLVDDRSESVFTMSEKFGAEPRNAVALLSLAKEHALEPYGISFNVGSQAKNAKAWGRGIKDIKKILDTLNKVGISLSVLDLGGGFPHRYENDKAIPTLKEVTDEISIEIKELPYPIKLLIEPGRSMVADACISITSVIGISNRSNGNWVFVDLGVYNGLLEALTCQGSIRYEIEPFLKENKNKKTAQYVLTGPTGDNLDVIHPSVSLPSDIKVGDKLIIWGTGAYSLSLSTEFNGFKKPPLL